ADQVAEHRVGEHVDPLAERGAEVVFQLLLDHLKGLCDKARGLNTVSHHSSSDTNIVPDNSDVSTRACQSTLRSRVRPSNDTTTRGTSATPSVPRISSRMRVRHCARSTGLVSVMYGRPRERSR